MSQRIQNKPFPEYRGDVEKWARDIKRHIESMQIDLVEDIKKTTEVWEDLRFPATAFNLPAAVKGASIVEYESGTAIDFTQGKDTQIRFNAQVPHAWKQGSDMEFHIHFATPCADSTGTVKFDFSYTWANIDADVTGSAGFSKTFTIGDNTTDHDFTEAIDHHWYLDIGDMTAVGMTKSSMLLCNLTRDTAVANNMAKAVYVMEADFHYIRDTNGSREELVK